MPDLLPIGSEFNDKETGLRLRVTGHTKDAYGRATEQVAIAETPPEAPQKQPRKSAQKVSARPRMQTVDTMLIIQARRPYKHVPDENVNSMVAGFLIILGIVVGCWVLNQPSHRIWGPTAVPTATSTRTR